ncbi:MAG: DnaJ domain-containing protein [Pseudomonadota bacterium]
MTYFLLGLVALVLILILMRGFTSASAAALAQVVRLVGGILALAMAVVFLVRGAVGYALPLGMLGLWLLSQAAGQIGRGGASGRDGARLSSVVTDHLEMELDLDTGDMRGRVRKGIFAGKSIEMMAPAELAILWQDCRFADPKSAQLLEAYLDRVHPTWREDMARAEQEAGAGGQMTVEEAYDILGLNENCSVDDIRRAHRELMLKMHPDRGGSSYLATKINQAKDVLLTHKRSRDA